MIREWWNRNRRVIRLILVVCLTMNITACGNGTRWIFSLNGEKLYHTDVDAFGYVYAMDHNIVNEGQMDEVYEDGDTYAQHYKKELEDEILSSVLLEQKAQEQGIKLDQKQLAECQRKAEALVTVYGEKRLKADKIEQQDIQNVYERKALGEQYVQAVSETMDEGEASSQKERYIEVYEVLFPTVLFGEDGMLISGTDGETRQVTAAEKEEQYSRAQEFTQKVTSGISLDTALSTYGDFVKASKKQLKYADLNTEYKNAIDHLKENQVSEIFEGVYGYYVVQLLQNNAAEYAEQIAGYEQQTKVQDKEKELLEQLYDSFVGTDKNYRNDKRWDTVEITDYLQ